MSQVIDTLDAGLSFVSLDSISTSAGVTSSNVAINLNDFNTIPTNAIGQDVTFDFGDLTNSNNSNATPETITLSYTALVQNIVTNQGEGVGTMLDNSAVFAWRRNGTPTQTTSATAPAIEVIEPELEVIKNVSTRRPMLATRSHSRSRYNMQPAVIPMRLTSRLAIPSRPVLTTRFPPTFP